MNPDDYLNLYILRFLLGIQNEAELTPEIVATLNSTIQ